MYLFAFNLSPEAEGTADKIKFRMLLETGCILDLPNRAQKTRSVRSRRFVTEIRKARITKGTMIIHHGDVKMV